MIGVDQVLRSRHTVGRNVNELAASYRQMIKEKLIEPLKAQSVTICPDFWSDPYKNISYLGLHVTFVDSQHQFYSIDLFCRPFIGVKSGDCVIKVSDAISRLESIDGYLFLRLFALFL